MWIFTRQKNLIEMKTCFSERKLMKPKWVWTRKLMIGSQCAYPLSHSPLARENYRPVSILLNIAKIYERCLNKQLEECFQELLSKYENGFWKGYSIIKHITPNDGKMMIVVPSELISLKRILCIVLLLKKYCIN